MRSSDPADWRHMVVPAPFNYVGEELRTKMEVASKPQEEAEKRTPRVSTSCLHCA